MRQLKWIAACVLILISLGLLSLYLALKSNQPLYDGEITLAVKEPVSLSRDAQGYVHIEATHRTDAAYALGFSHAQERFFQMDLLRKNSAGELASLIGPMALQVDIKHRRHRFRARADLAFQALPYEQKQLIERYAQGVNAGLLQLGLPPFEYWLLQQKPAPWHAADSFLALYSMYLDLQESEGRAELAMGYLKKELPKEWFDFFMQHSSDWQAALDDSQVTPLPAPSSAYPALFKKTETLACKDCGLFDSKDIGSNNFAVAGHRTADGRAILADDMHLGIRVPGTWYKAKMSYQHDGKAHWVAGVTLPGTPLVIAGSNGHIAWGFTNSTADWSDVIALTVNDSGTEYLSEEGWQEFSYENEVIKVKGQADVVQLYKETLFGPVLAKPFESYAQRWVAHDIEGANFNLLELEHVKTAQQALRVASRVGVPTQNLVVADSQGAIGWTLIGALPERTLQDMDTPQDWTNGHNRWQGYLGGEHYPAILNPQSGQLWTANSRMIGGKSLSLIGNGGYDLGARGLQIRDALSQSQLHSEQSLHQIQLDHRALFLKRWQELALHRVLTEEFVQKHQLQDYLDFVQNDVSHASPNSVGYGLVRAFRAKTLALAFSPLTAFLESKGLQGHNLKFSLESAAWELLHLPRTDTVPAGFANWQTLLETALLESKQKLETDYTSLANATWGAQNTSQIHHPLASALPLVGAWLNMPAHGFAGDSHMPRVQNKVHGQSERMVVSPGHEEEGILTIPAGQSGHPLSPFYRADHAFWQAEKPLGFLPGKTEYLLKMQPEA